MWTPRLLPVEYGCYALPVAARYKIPALEEILAFSMRPEELIADIYRQLRERQSEGNEPVKVVMSLEHCRLLQWYKNFIGEAADGSLDYLEEYKIFGLEILIERMSRPVVE